MFHVSFSYETPEGLMYWIHIHKYHRWNSFSHDIVCDRTFSFWRNPSEESHRYCSNLLILSLCLYRRKYTRKSNMEGECSFDSHNILRGHQTNVCTRNDLSLFNWKCKKQLLKSLDTWKIQCPSLLGIPRLSLLLVLQLEH